MLQGEICTYSPRQVDIILFPESLSHCGRIQTKIRFQLFSSAAKAVSFILLFGEMAVLLGNCILISTKKAFQPILQRGS